MAARRDPEPPTARAAWRVWGVEASIVVGDPASLTGAAALAEGVLAEIGAACSRFDDASELSRLSRDPAAAAGVEVSPLLAELVGAALQVAADTGGSVDPTLGADLAGWGYDRDLAALPTPATAGPPLTGGTTLSVVPRDPAWRRVRLDGRLLALPAGTLLDLGATAKAFAADRIARRIAEAFHTRVLVSLGGDIATAGPAGSPGWEVTVQDLDGDPSQQVRLPSGAGLATSSTQKRRWLHDGRTVQHILDPAFGTPVVPAWRSASVAAPTCLRANALSTAAIVRGRAAVDWLARQGADARLVDLEGRVVRVGAWPQPLNDALAPAVTGGADR